MSKDFDNGYKQGLKEAGRLAGDEIKAAEKELDYAKKPESNFASSTNERTQVRLKTAKKILAAIRKLMG